MNEKDMMERYLYEVTRRVPQEMREEIALELQSLIEDMCREEEITIEAVLQKLGDPAEFAKRYKDGPDYLIGPEYYDNYMWVVKIALIGIAISAVVSAFVQGITGTRSWTDFFVGFWSELFTNAINGAYSMIGIVTIIFAVLEWKKVKVSIKPQSNWTVGDLSKNAANVKSWTPNSLPPVPDKRAVIGRGESVFTIIFITVFAALLLFAPQLFGVFHYDGEKLVSMACVFNLDAWDRIVVVFVFCLFAAMVDEIIRLVTGYYCKVVMCSTIISDAIQIVGGIILLKGLPLWNPNFVQQIQEYAGVNKFSDADILNYWGNESFNNMILAGICVIACIESGVAVYKTIRYAK